MTPIHEPVCHPPAPATQLRLRAAREAGDAAAALLRRAGCRPTAQRLLVLQALGDGDHVSADAILARARERYPSMDPSTVYRTLDALASAGIARRTDLGSERLFFEVAREHRHHHAVCEGCGAVAHLHDLSLRPLALALRAESGFELTRDREVAIPGRCPDCQGASPGAPTERKDDRCTSPTGS
jgi:Fur family ferric uptake transcriptional regulator